MERFYAENYQGFEGNNGTNRSIDGICSGCIFICHMPTAKKSLQL